MSLLEVGLALLPKKVRPIKEDMALLDIDGFKMQSVKLLITSPESFYEESLITLLKRQNVIPDAMEHINYLLDRDTKLSFSEHEHELELKRFAYIKDQDVMRKLYLKSAIPVPRLLGMIVHASRHNRIASVKALRQLLGEKNYAEVELRLFKLACVMGNVMMLTHLIETKTLLLRLSHLVDVAIDNNQNECVRLLFISGASNRLLTEDIVKEALKAEDKKFLLWMKESKAKVYLPDYYIKYIELIEDNISLIGLLPTCEEYNKGTLLKALSKSV